MNDNEAQIKKAEQLLYRLINLCYESAQKKACPLFITATGSICRTSITPQKSASKN